MGTGGEKRTNVGIEFDHCYEKITVVNAYQFDLMVTFLNSKSIE